MNHNFHESRDDNEKVEPEELLEDCWFFGSLLDRKPRMLRSYSDPYSSSSNYNQESNLSYEETYDSINKLSSNSKEQTPSKQGSLQRIKSSRRTSSSNGLVRAPSLPTSLENQDSQDEEIEFSMGKLIRQASLNYSNTLPPRKHAHKSVITNSSLSRQKSRKKQEQETIKCPFNQLKTQRSLKELESEELQGFKDLGFDFNKNELSPDVVSIIPGLQEKKFDENRRTTPYLSEAWAAQSSAPPVPRWGGKRSTDDMKAQIKFWARAVRLTCARSVDCAHFRNYIFWDIRLWDEFINGLT